jgi:predicted nucleic-acid-binding Zn-ribbon protein
MENKKCSKCGGDIEEGIFVDNLGPWGYGKLTYANNVKWGGLSVSGKRSVVVYRCTSCGYVEIYTK